MRENAEKMRTRITLNKDTFYAVLKLSVKNIYCLYDLEQLPVFCKPLPYLKGRDLSDSVQIRENTDMITDMITSDYVISMIRRVFVCRIIDIYLIKNYYLTADYYR